jgi:hypothetical protein
MTKAIRKGFECDGCMLEVRSDSRRLQYLEAASEALCAALEKLIEGVEEDDIEEVAMSDNYFVVNGEEQDG